MDSSIVGIIGTLAGTVLGAVLAIIPQHLGKLRINISASILRPVEAMQFNTEGAYSNVTSWEKAEAAEIEFFMYIHNSKSFPLSYRNIYMEVCPLIGEISSEIIINRNKQDNETGGFLVLNIQPLVMLIFDCKVHISGITLDDMKKYPGKTKFYLCMESYNGYKRRVVIPYYLNPGIEKRSVSKVLF